MKWQLIKVSNESTVRSLAIDQPTQRIYVGAQDDLGYLKSNAAGSLKFISLVSHIPDESRTFGDVWKTYATEEGVFFQTFSHLFLWSDNQMKVVDPSSQFHFSFYVNGVLYMNDNDHGLQKFQSDDLLNVPGTNILLGKRIQAMIPMREDELLICTRNNGLFV